MAIYLAMPILDSKSDTSKFIQNTGLVKSIQKT